MKPCIGWRISLPVFIKRGQLCPYQDRGQGNQALLGNRWYFLGAVESQGMNFTEYASPEAATAKHGTGSLHLHFGNLQRFASDSCCGGQTTYINGLHLCRHTGSGSCSAASKSWLAGVCAEMCPVIKMASWPSNVLMIIDLLIRFIWISPCLLSSVTIWKFTISSPLSSSR